MKRRAKRPAEEEEGKDKPAADWVVCAVGDVSRIVNIMKGFVFQA